MRRKQRQKGDRELQSGSEGGEKCPKRQQWWSKDEQGLIDMQIAR